MRLSLRNSPCGSNPPIIQAPPEDGELEPLFVCAVAELGDDGLTPVETFPSPNSCSSYIVCVDLIAYEIPCPEGEIYEDEIKACLEREENSTCTE